MKTTFKITFTALISALMVVIMLTAYFPFLTYAIPAVAGMFAVVIVIEVDKKWAFAAYAVSSVIVFFIAETEAKILFIFFFGFYPIIKEIIEKNFKNRVVEYIVKLVIFNACFAAAYALLTIIFNIPLFEMDKYGLIVAVALPIVLGEAVFFCYDLCLTKIIALYMYRLHDKINRFVK